MTISVWVLTFNRPVAVSRLIKNFGQQGLLPNVFSNSPTLAYTEGVRPRVDTGLEVINTLNHSESNSWCARSWNTIFMKAFYQTKDDDDGVICIQDDTDIGPGFVNWVYESAKSFDFISGPAGDQFFFIKLKVLKAVGWWDERFIGCYAADADFFKRVHFSWEPDRVSIVDTHNWGWVQNDIGLRNFVNTEMYSKTIDYNYENQHWALEKIGDGNPTLKAAQLHYERKWGTSLDNGKPATLANMRSLGEIDWYPWASQKWKMNTHV